MKKIKRTLAVFLYLFIVSVTLQLELVELVNLRQLVLVLVGGILLYLPGTDRESWKEKNPPDYELVARSTLYASYIATFILFFSMLYGGLDNGAEQISESAVWDVELIMRNIALSLRPLLYGVCIWIALGGEESINNKSVDRKIRYNNENNNINNNVNDRNVRSEPMKRNWTAQECYEGFIELGLTRREAEIAVQVGKGLSNKEIAMELNITEATVKKHVANIFEKLKVQKREEIRERLKETMD